MGQKSEKKAGKKLIQKSRTIIFIIFFILTESFNKKDSTTILKNEIQSELKESYKRAQEQKAILLRLINNLKSYIYYLEERISALKADLEFSNED